MLAQPGGVGRRHHQVLFALPDQHGHLDRGDVEAPRPEEGEVVVHPPVDARRQAVDDRCQQVLGELAGQRLRVDVAEVWPERVGQLVRRGLGEARRVGAAELGERVAALASGAELGDVALPHPGHEVEAGRIGRADAGERRRRGAAAAQERRAGEGVRAAARGAVGREALDAERVEDRRHVGRRRGDVAVAIRRRAAVAGPRVGDEAQPARLRALDLAPMEKPGARRAVVRDEHRPVGRARLHDLERAPVRRAH